MSEKKVKEIDFTKNDISEDWIKNCQPLKNLEKNILLTNFENEFLKKNIEVEFRILKRITNTNLHIKKMFKNGFKNFSEKNRYNHIIPFTHSMPKCFCNLKKNEKKGFSGFYSNLNEIEKTENFISNNNYEKKNIKEDNLHQSEFFDDESEIKKDVQNNLEYKINYNIDKNTIDNKIEINNKNSEIRKNEKFEKLNNKNFKIESNIDKLNINLNNNNFDINFKKDRFKTNKKTDKFDINVNKFSINGKKNQFEINEKKDKFEINQKINKFDTIPKIIKTNINQKNNNPKIENLKRDENFYINADFINHPLCTDTSNTYIVTQFPNKYSVEDFWHLIFEKKIKFIVMLNNLDEDSFVRKEKYFPKNGEKFAKGIFEITNLGELSAEFLSFKKIEIKVIKKENEISPKKTENQKEKANKKKHIITHYNLKTWVDHSVIKKSEYPLFFEFIKITSKHLKSQNIKKKKNQKSPLLIHCKAGIGRSGAFLTILFIYEYFLDLKEIYGDDFIKNRKFVEEQEIGISIFSVVRQLREDRWGMVEKPNQYFFLYDFVCFMIRKYEFIN